MNDPAMTDFERYFETEFPKLLKSISGPSDLFTNGSSLKDASWDRKAAYMLYEATRSVKPQPAQGLLF